MTRNATFSDYLVALDKCKYFIQLKLHCVFHNIAVLNQLKRKSVLALAGLKIIGSDVRQNSGTSKNETKPQQMFVCALLSSFLVHLVNCSPSVCACSTCISNNICWFKITVSQSISILRKMHYRWPSTSLELPYHEEIGTGAPDYLQKILNTLLYRLFRQAEKEIFPAEHVPMRKPATRRPQCPALAAGTQIGPVEWAASGDVVGWPAADTMTNRRKSRQHRADSM